MTSRRAPTHVTRAAARAPRRRCAGLLALACVCLAPALAAGARRAAFHVEYEPPRDPEYERYYEAMRQHRFLEDVVRALGFIRLPAPIVLRSAECGEPNAWYDPETRAVTFCYEQVKELAEDAAAVAPERLGHEDAVFESLVFLFLHEIAHALFDLLDVPILGREEDAADQLAAYILLRSGPHGAKRTLAAAAWMYDRRASRRQADESDYADVHGLDSQRYYNLLCLAYGSDPRAYASVRERPDHPLPADRAEGCEDEYRQVDHAVQSIMGNAADRSAFTPSAPRTTRGPSRFASSFRR